jgi:hypothetical protein
MIRELIDTELEAVAGGLTGNQNTVTLGNITLNPTINANGGTANANGGNSNAQGGNGGGVFNVSGFNFTL